MVIYLKVVLEPTYPLRSRGLFIHIKLRFKVRVPYLSFGFDILTLPFQQYRDPRTKMTVVMSRPLHAYNRISIDLLATLCYP